MIWGNTEARLHSKKLRAQRRCNARGPTQVPPALAGWGNGGNPGKCGFSWPGGQRDLAFGGAALGSLEWGGGGHGGHVGVLFGCLGVRDVGPG